jgi:sulfide:quinone oxidoreductase
LYRVFIEPCHCLLYPSVVAIQNESVLHLRVYAVGDVVSSPTPSGYVPYLPKAGVFAHGQAEVVANNIAVQVRGKGKLKAWAGDASCFLEVGQGKAAFVKGNFMASPRPDIKFHMPDKIWHMQKVLFEKYWMHHWF